MREKALVHEVQSQQSSTSDEMQHFLMHSEMSVLDKYYLNKKKEITLYRELTLAILDPFSVISWCHACSFWLKELSTLINGIWLYVL